MAKPKDVFNPIYVFREQGANSNVLQRPDRAKLQFDKSLAYSPNDRRSLLGRAQAYLTMNRSAAAQKDAEQVLNKLPNLCWAKSLKCQAQYQAGEYETALVGNRRGLKIRRCPLYFDMGTMQSEETIEDCIGRHVGPVLLDSYKAIQNMLAYEREHAQDEEEPVQTDGQRLRKERKKDRVERLYGAKYLGRLAKDKIFLQNLIKNPYLVSPNKIGTAKLRQVAIDAYDMVHERQEVLRERKPFYALKYHEATVSATLLRRKQEEFEKKQFRTRDSAKNQLEKLRAARETLELKTYLDNFELALEFFDGVSDKLLPKKQDFLEATYNISSLAFLDVMRVNKNRTEEEQLGYVHQDIGLPTSGFGSSIQLQKIRMPIIDIRKCIKNREQRLAEAMSNTEKAWCFFELARLNFEILKYDLSRMYAKKCVQEAKLLGHLAWVINGSMVLVRLEVLSRSKSDSVAAMDDARDAARKMKDEAVIKYLKIASQALEEADFDDLGDDGIEAREKRLLQLMAGTNVKEDMAYLFRRMKMMDASKRMSIMPGVRAQDRAAGAAGGGGKNEDNLSVRESKGVVKQSSVEISKSQRERATPGAQSAVAPTSAIAKRRSVAPQMRLGLDDD